MNTQRTEVKIIAKCLNEHYFLCFTDLCPRCGGAIEETFSYRQGDCVSCGWFCPEYAYGCCTPILITPRDIALLEIRFSVAEKVNVLPKSQ